MSRRSPWRALLLSCAALLSGNAVAAADVVRVDLDSMIEKAAANPEQFAVEVPHLVSLTSAGSWSGAGDRRTLRYSVSVPGAVSLSFHASRIILPPSAMLTVSSESTTVLYRSADVHNGSLWSRIQVGDALEFVLEVDAGERPQVVLDIVGFQVGYRGLSPKVKSHDAYLRARSYAAGDPDTHCVENYTCHITGENRSAGQATVALTVNNVYLCTGTLVNNTARDNTPYIMTARHCAGGEFNANVPNDLGIIIYWNSVSACGDPLGLVLYSPSPRRQNGTKTAYAHQDIWLLKLDTAPVVDDAVLAGFDASGGDVVGGYSVHHALAYHKQFTRWHGRAFPFVMGPDSLLPLPLDVLSVVNEFGVSGPGASGGALFSQDHRVVGVASLAPIARSQSGYGQCPVASPSEPSQSNGSVYFNALSGVWDAPSSGTPGSVTLKSLLDPQNTGAKFVESMVASRLQFSAWNTRPVNTDGVSLEWSSRADSCTASGGVQGDGWTGALPGTGRQIVRYSGEGEITYRLVCPLPGGGTVAGSVTLQWSPPVPATYATTSRTVAWPTVPVEFSWKSNYGPCTVSVNGGATLQADLPAVGSLTVTSPVAAIVSYRATCGTPGRMSYANGGVNYMPPVLNMASSGAARRPGEVYHLLWESHADTCIPTGGSPGDEWSGVARGGSGWVRMDVTTEGTFEYRLQCTGGSFTQSKTFTLVVDDAPPFIELLPVRTTVTYAMNPADYIHYRFRTNLSECERQITGVGQRNIDSSPDDWQPGFFHTEGVESFAPDKPGSGTLTVTCHPWQYGANAGTPSVSASIPFTVHPPDPPTAVITANLNTVTVADTLTITWTGTSTRLCQLGSGGTPGHNGEYVETSGSRTWKGSEMAVGEFEYWLYCESLDGLHQPALGTVRFRVLGPPPNPPPATGGEGGNNGGNAGGGGGSTRWAELMLLLGLLVLRQAWKKSPIT